MKIKIILSLLVGIAQGNSKPVKVIQLKQLADHQAQKDPCCMSCEEPKQKHVSFEEVYNNCLETCIYPNHLWKFRLVDPNIKTTD